MIFGQFLSRVRKSASRSDERRHVNFFDLREVRPIGNTRGNSITNKAGRAVLSARYQGQVVKLYEAFSEEHANFISAVSAALPDLFPAVLEVRGAWVMTEWVEGQPLSEDVEAHQAKVLRRIHSLALNDLPPVGFCYLNDFIIPRCMRAAKLAGTPETLNEYATEIEFATDARTLMHPDVSPNNLLQTADGRLVCIDNELLSVGRMPLLDLCNAMRPLPQVGREKLAGIWFGDSAPLPNVVDRLALAWVMREAGAALRRGDFLECNDLLEARGTKRLALLPIYFTFNERHA